MRKIRISEHISLDGVIQPGGPNENSEYSHGGWTAPYRTPEGAAAVAAAYGGSFDLLLDQGLVDEVVLAVYPLLLGRGKRCFSDSADPRALALVSTKAFPSGIVFSTYKVVGPSKTA